MTNIKFSSETLDITPVGNDRLLISDTSNGGAASDAPLSALPISTATQAELDLINTDLDLKATIVYVDSQDALKVDKTTTVNGHALSSNVTVSKGDVGLGNVDNTSDANKPISTATQTALDGKVSSVVAGTNISVDNTDTQNPIVSLSLGADKNFVTDAEKVILGNTSNTNTGDQTADTLPETATKVFVTPDEKTAITHSNRTDLDLVSGTNTGDQDLSGLMLNKQTATFTWDSTGYHFIPFKVYPGQYTAHQFGLLSADITAVRGVNFETGVTSAHLMALPGTNNFSIDYPLNYGISILTSTASGSITFDTTPSNYFNRDHRFMDSIGTNTHAQIDTAMTRLANTSGTNTGDQTSIVGITGTTAEFNTALTDGDFATLAGTEALTNKDITSATNKFSKISPSSDSTTAIQITKADGTTNVLNVDTTNNTIGIGTTTPGATLETNGNILIRSTVSDGRSLVFSRTASAFGTATNYINGYDETAGHMYFGVGFPTGGFKFMLDSTTRKGGTEAFTIADNGRIGLLASTPSYDLSLGGNTARTIGLERHTTADNAGSSMTIRGGGCTVGGTDLNGGTLELRGGLSTGLGRGDIAFYTNKRGSTGTIDNIDVLSAYLLNIGNPRLILGNSGTSTDTVDGINMVGTYAQNIYQKRHTTADTAGNSLTISAGGATVGATNKSAGKMIISSGPSTGTGIGVVEIWTTPPSSSGTSDNSPGATFGFFRSSGATTACLTIGTISGTDVRDGIVYNGQTAQNIYQKRNTTANTAGNSLAIQAGGATSGATDKNGGTNIIKSGISTGTGSSEVEIWTATAQASTNTTDNAPTLKMKVTGMGAIETNSITKRLSGSKALTDNSAVGFIDIAVAASDMVGGTLHYTIKATNGTDFQCHSGVYVFSAINKAGTVTSASSEIGQSETTIVSTGTLTDTFSITNGTGKITLNMNANTSLASTTTFKIDYEVIMQSITTLTPL